MNKNVDEGILAMRFKNFNVRRKMTDCDLIRREVIENFLCQDGINVVEIENRYDINLKTFFEGELAVLDQFVEEDMLDRNEHELKVTEL